VLPGNNDRHTLHLLGRKFEEEIERSIDRSGFQPVLLMQYENYQSALDLVRQKVAPLPAGILIENAALRPFVRQLIGLDSWLIPILSRPELLAGLEGRIASESELEQTA
jgi:type III secretory pathway component EscV